MRARSQPEAGSCSIGSDRKRRGHPAAASLLSLVVSTGKRFEARSGGCLPSGPPAAKPCKSGRPARRTCGDPDRARSVAGRPGLSPSVKVVPRPLRSRQPGDRASPGAKCRAARAANDQSRTRSPRRVVGAPQPIAGLSASAQARQGRIADRQAQRQRRGTSGPSGDCRRETIWLRLGRRETEAGNTTYRTAAPRSTSESHCCPEASRREGFDGVRLRGPPLEPRRLHRRTSS
jgi:hypothetical protein